MKKNPFVFLDVSIDGLHEGRVVIELFLEACPHVAECFFLACARTSALPNVLPRSLRVTETGILSSSFDNIQNVSVTLVCPGMLVFLHHESFNGDGRLSFGTTPLWTYHDWNGMGFRGLQIEGELFSSR